MLRKENILKQCKTIGNFRIVQLHKTEPCLLYFGSIRMNILMLDTRNVEQTKDVRMYT